MLGRPQTGRSPNPRSSLGNGELSSHIPGQAAPRAAENGAQGGFAQHRAPKHHKSRSPPGRVWGHAGAPGPGWCSRPSPLGPGLESAPASEKEKICCFKTSSLSSSSAGEAGKTRSEAARQWSALSAGLGAQAPHAALQVFPAGPCLPVFEAGRSLPLCPADSERPRRAA